MVFQSKFCTFLHFGIGWVGHNAAKLHNGLARLVQDTGDLVIDAVLLNAPAAVGQQNCTCPFRQTGQLFLHTALAKVDLCIVLKNKVVHHHAPFLKISLCEWRFTSALPKKRQPL